MAIEMVERKSNINKIFRPLNVKKLSNETQGEVFIHDHVKTYIENKENKQSTDDIKTQSELKSRLKHFLLSTLIKISILISVSPCLYLVEDMTPIHFINVFAGVIVALTGIITLWSLYNSSKNFFLIYEVFNINKQISEDNRQIEKESFESFLAYLNTPVVLDGSYVDRLYRFLKVDESNTNSLIFDFKTKDFNLISVYNDKLAKESIEYQAKRIANLSEKTLIDIYTIIKEKEEMRNQIIYQKRKERAYEKFTSNIYLEKESPLEESLKHVDNQIKTKQKEKRRNYEQSVKENQDLIDNLLKREVEYITKKMK